jgi:hypothetical protein
MSVDSKWPLANSPAHVLLSIRRHIFNSPGGASFGKMVHGLPLLFPIVAAGSPTHDNVKWCGSTPPALDKALMYAPAIIIVPIQAAPFRRTVLLAWRQGRRRSVAANASLALTRADVAEHPWIVQNR